MDFWIRQTSTASPAEPGELLCWFMATLTNAIADKLTYRQIAALVEREYGYNRIRAELIAHTEVALATSRGNYAHSVLIGMKVKKWLLSNDPGVCSACQENAAQGWIPILQLFASGVQAPSQHAGCRCDAVYLLNAPNRTKAP
ncbi:MAG: hypothetical protein EPN38_06550 [Rhodanobacteraceae bacterium]|nr:MAG: hypothetical protein EPN38_06550 [Rhodanobacteraceae bacterium]